MNAFKNRGTSQELGQSIMANVLMERRERCDVTVPTVGSSYPQQSDVWFKAGDVK